MWPSSFYPASMYCPSSNYLAGSSSSLWALNIGILIRLRPKPPPPLISYSLHTRDFKYYLCCRLVTNFYHWPRLLLSIWAQCIQLPTWHLYFDVAKASSSADPNWNSWFPSVFPLSSSKFPGSLRVFLSQWIALPFAQLCKLWNVKDTCIPLPSFSVHMCYVSMVHQLGPCTSTTIP